MERVCFIARIRPGRAAEYRERHEAVWQEMREALRAAGWANYSLFLAEPGAADGGSDGAGALLVGYLETDDYAAALRAMAQTSVNDRWQAEMAPFFADLGGGRPDERFRRLDEIFHLD